MAQVAFAAAGAQAATNAVNSINVAYPASISANDLLLLVLVAGEHDSLFDTPSGWTRHPGVSADVEIGTAATISATCIAVFYTWATGSESGSLTCTRGITTDHFAGRMYRYNGFTATGGDPFVGSATNTGTDASVESPATSAAATADNDMGLLIAVISDDNTLGNFDEAAESVEWTESVADTLVTAGNDSLTSVNHCATVTNGNTIPANLETMAASDPWWVLTCIVKESAGSGAQNVSVTGLASAGAFGAPTITTGNVNVSVTGLASAGAFGTVTVSQGGQVVEVTGLGSAAAFGSVATIPGNVNVQVPGLDSASQFGNVSAQGGDAATFIPAIHGGKH